MPAATAVARTSARKPIRRVSARRLDAKRIDGLPSGGPFAYVPPMKRDLSVIRKRSDFLAANRGLRIARPGFVLLARPNEGQGKRYGITVTKKIGNAVVRNRMKRRFRELLRSALPEAGLPDHDHILIGREGGVERNFGQLREELAIALSRAAEGKGDRPRALRHRRSRRA